MPYHRGGTVGCETAHFLKYELGIGEVTVVEISPYIMKRHSLQTEDI
jgi:pyruvate/2-oxoglutarate dehydrogenase complex dihydrolipoamide dehydrogenase (E3) component